MDLNYASLEVSEDSYKPSKLNNCSLYLRKSINLDDDNSLYREFENKRTGKWSAEEDKLLDRLVSLYGTRNWKKISEEIQTRSPVQCLHRWTKILKPGLTKGPWVLEEDKKLIEWVRLEGPHKWSQCAEFIPGRSGKQCRERWFNTLNPQVKKGNWTSEEDYNIFKLFSIFGSKWSKIALSFPGRTENSVKNRFYSTLRRISSESRKSLNSCNVSVIDDSESKTPCNLDSLLKFYPQAFEEKKKLYYDEINRVDQIKEEKLINKKTKRNSFRVPCNSNINNTYNINVNISTPSHTTCAHSHNEFKLNSVEELESMISNFTSENLKFDNYTLSNCDKANEVNKTESVSILLSQLNELETLLLNTKKQLCNYDLFCMKNVNTLQYDVHNEENAKIENMFKFEQS